ncbi:MAG: hypothetical protein ACRCU3_10305 [Eubacteriaceae bacterium]
MKTKMILVATLALMLVTSGGVMSASRNRHDTNRHYVTNPFKIILSKERMIFLYVS